MIKKSNTIIIYGISAYEKLICRIIKELHLDEHAFDIKLILTEAISNAFYHGNGEDASKPISINYEFDGRVLSIKIKDEGYKDKTLHIPEEIEERDILSEGGRGLFLIQCLADKVIYEKNTLIINKCIAYG